MSKRKKALAFRNPKRIEFIAPAELVDDVTAILHANDLTLSCYCRYCMKVLEHAGSSEKLLLLASLKGAVNEGRT